MVADKHAIAFRGGSTRQGVSKYSEQLESFGKVSWMRGFYATLRSSPVCKDQRIFIGTGNEKFVCLNKQSGELIWEIPTEGSVNSTAAIEDSFAYFTSGGNYLYAVDIETGKIKWKTNLGKPLPYLWLFDYYTSSPVIFGQSIFVGGGDGALYCFDRDGKQKWKFSSGARIHSSPAIANGLVVVGNHDGSIFACEAKSGELKWRFETEGTKFENEKEGFDRKAIIASPTISGNKVVIGGRDGYLYAINLENGKEIWRYNYDVSWVVSSAAISDGIVVSGTSDGKKINALDLSNGKVLWSHATKSPVFSSPVIAGETVVAVETQGTVSALELKTGKLKHRQRLSMERIFSTPWIDDDGLFVGTDDGELFSLTLTNVVPTRNPVHKAVYWTSAPRYQAFRFGIDRMVKDYFMESNYSVLNDSLLTKFMNERISDKQTAVVVLATNLFPQSAVGDTVETNVVKKFLQAGGKIVALHQNPGIYSFINGEFQGFDYRIADKVMGMKYPFSDLRNHGGFYQATPTEEGKRWGLRESFTGLSGIPFVDKSISILAQTENGGASAWVKNYGGKNGTGFVQLWISPTLIEILPQIQNVAEYGLEK
jgi:eukaryotic-like serine/threonine-protein kinase